MTYLRETLSGYKVPNLECDVDISLLPYGISYENLTYDVPYLEKGERLIDMRHYNAYLIVPRLVYHMSTKLMNESIQNRLGQDKDFRLIQFITRYGYATRANSYCKLHGAYTKYTRIHNVTYINNCDDWNRIIPVTMFLVMPFNACFMYQASSPGLKASTLCLVGNSDFRFRFLGPPSEAEFRFRFQFRRFSSDFFLKSPVEKMTNRNSDSKIWNSEIKFT
jgi:hypothetical protein